MNKLQFILLIIMCLVACESSEVELQAESPTGTLCLNLSRYPIPHPTRTIDQSLALQITNEYGSVVGSYSPGNAPASLQLPVGEYTLCVYTDNQSTWPDANQGLGEASYSGETTITIVEDQTVYCNYQVPQTNYAVTLTLPDLFDVIFTHYTFHVSSGSRDVNLIAGQKAYFDPSSNGFTYQLQVTNADNQAYSHSTSQGPSVLAGKLYNVTYSYGSGSGDGNVKVYCVDNVD